MYSGNFAELLRKVASIKVASYYQTTRSAGNTECKLDEKEQRIRKAKAEQKIAKLDSALSRVLLHPPITKHSQWHPQASKFEVVDPKKEKPMQACRVATMGRLSELKLVNWTIEKPNGWSKYELTPKGEEYLSHLVNPT